MTWTANNNCSPLASAKLDKIDDIQRNDGEENPNRPVFLRKTSGKTTWKHKNDIIQKKIMTIKRDLIIMSVFFLVFLLSKR